MNVLVSGLNLSPKVAGTSTTSKTTISSAAPPATIQQQQQQDVSRIQYRKEQEARQSHNNQVFNALFVSVPERNEPVAIRHTIGKRPKDFPSGAILRLGPNGASKSDGFLDGDGLLHCIIIPPTDSNTPLTYSSAYIDTQGRRLEQEKGGGRGKFIGSLGAAPEGFPLLFSVVRNMIRFQVGTKDTCNTALGESGGRLLALMEQAPPSEIEICKDGTIRTVATKTDLDGAIPANDPLTGGTFGAHGKTCPETGERIHVSYGSSSRPFARVDVFEKDWKLKTSVDVSDLSCPVMIHDCAITKNYALVLDFPLTIRPMRMLMNRFPVEYDPDHGARIGLVPRRDGMDHSDIRWFRCKPGVILHTVNAYETDDDKVILHALRSEPKTNGSYITSYTTSFLYEWVLDLKDGTVIREECLNPIELVEFPIIDDRFIGQNVKDCYAIGVKSIGGPLEMYKTPMEGISIDRILKFSLMDDKENGIRKGDVIGRFHFPKGWYGVTEPTIVPKVGGEDGAKGCYMVAIATYVPETPHVPLEEEIAKDNVLTSRVFVVDGDNFDAGAIWEFDLPYHLPYGLHSGFLNWEHLK
jgi:Lignostilbene-alpha,beta-dioxygenase and related enzymes